MLILYVRSYLSISVSSFLQSIHLCSIVTSFLLLSINLKAVIFRLYNLQPTCPSLLKKKTPIPLSSFKIGTWEEASPLYELCDIPRSPNSYCAHLAHGQQRDAMMTACQDWSVIKISVLKKKGLCGGKMFISHLHKELFAQIKKLDISSLAKEKSDLASFLAQAI